MRIQLLLLSLTFTLAGMAQFNTIAPAGSRISKIKPKDQPQTEIAHSASQDSIIDERKTTFQSSGGESIQKKISIHPPLKGELHISSKYGTRRNPFGKNATEHHSGIDLRAKAGTPIYAMLPGTVESIGYDSRSGNFIKLRHGNFTVSYCHLIKKPTIPIGTKVNAGSAVAFVGSTGRSTGPHLHITAKINGRVIDPAIFLQLLSL